MRPTGIYPFRFLFRGPLPLPRPAPCFPYFAFVVFSTGEKSLAARCTLRSIFYFLQYVTFSVLDEKKGRKREGEKKRSSHDSSKKIRGRLEFASLSSPTLHPSNDSFYGINRWFLRSFSPLSFSTTVLRRKRKEKKGKEKFSRTRGEFSPPSFNVRQRVAPTTRRLIAPRRGVEPPRA